MDKRWAITRVVRFFIKLAIASCTSFSDSEMKEQVIFAASQRGDRESVDFLMEVAENPENGELREQAIFWLGQSEDSRVPEFLLRIIGR